MIEDRGEEVLVDCCWAEWIAAEAGIWDADNDDATTWLVGDRFDDEIPWFVASAVCILYIDAVIVIAMIKIIDIIVLIVKEKLFFKLPFIVFSEFEIIKIEEGFL